MAMYSVPGRCLVRLLDFMPMPTFVRAILTRGLKVGRQAQITPEAVSTTDQLVATASDSRPWSGFESYENWTWADHLLVPPSKL